MENREVQSLTKDLLDQFYNQGIAAGFRDNAAPDISFFGIRGNRFYSGVEAVIPAIGEEIAGIAPAHIMKIRLREQQVDDQNNVIASVVVRSVHDVSPVIHRWIFMYRQGVMENELCGVHITRDVHHEATYRMICAQRLGADSRINRVAEMMEAQESLTFGSQCAHITYKAAHDGEQLEMAYFSPTLWKMLEYETEEEFVAACGRRLSALVDPEDQARVLSAAQVKEGDTFHLEYRLRTREGGTIWAMETGRVLPGAAGDYAYSVVTNISGIRNKGRRLIYQLAFDELTGIFNKNTFYSQIGVLLETNPATDFEIMRFDIRRFKVINELFGEGTGDNILRYLADFLREVKMPHFVYGRLHSDHFLLCYPSSEGARQRLIQTIATMAMSFTSEYRIEVCFGVYQIKERNLPVNIMVDRAGIALAKAKASITENCCVYDENMRRRIIDEQAFLNDMNQALREGEFLIYLQPKFSLNTELMVGAEALVRWNHPERGLISPSDFIPVFEHNGSIFELDKYIWDNTCRLMRRWIDSGYPALPVSINVSRVDIYRDDLVDTLDGIVKKYDLSPALVGLEVTESAYTDNPEQIIEVTKRLQLLGFKILMDDFGSGYSSLNMLKDMPVDILKIDLRFLDSYEENGRGGNILNSVVRMAKWLRIPVIAEGVETHQQAEFLRSIGCEQAQGYYFSKPLAAREYERLLRDVGASGVRRRIGDTVEGEQPDVGKFTEWGSTVMTLVDTVNESIGLYERRGDELVLVRANNAYFRAFDENPEQAGAMDIREKIHPGDWGDILQAIDQSKSTNETVSFAIRGFMRGGKVMWLRLQVRVVASDITTDYFYMAMKNITSEKTALKQLNDTIDSVPGGILHCSLIDDKIRVLYMSRWFYRLPGFAPNERGRDLAHYVGELFDTENERKLAAVIKEAAHQERSQSLEYLYKGRNGRKYWLGASFTARQLSNGMYSCYGVFYDLSDVNEDKLS